jgi:hypothetical protein
MAGMNGGKYKSFDFKENRQNHDFLYVLFPVRTGDSGFIMTGLIRGLGGNNGTSD